MGIIGPESKLSQPLCYDLEVKREMAQDQRSNPGT